MLPSLWQQPGVQAWTTVFAALCIQSAPYLVLGVTVSTLIAVFVPPSFFERVLPRRPALAVPVAGAAGVVLPGCECGSVPVAASLMRRGVAAAPAIAFLLAAPAINPVVLVATSVAFPGRPEMVAARFAASLLTAVVVGWLWLRVGRVPPLPVRFRRSEGAPAGSRAERARATAAHDLAQSIGLLTIGAAAAATVNVAVPETWLNGVAGHLVLGVVALALLAVVVAVCSEADAFVAASFARFSPTAQLAFMAVGPAVDVKLVAMQAGTFGARVAARLAPLTFVVALGSAALVGWWLL
ncbi:permease [Jatrophihabitans fulvus]